MTWGGYTVPVQMDEISGCADIYVHSYAVHAVLGYAVQQMHPKTQIAPSGCTVLQHFTRHPEQAAHY